MLPLDTDGLMFLFTARDKMVRAAHVHDLTLFTKKPWLRKKKGTITLSICVPSVKIPNKFDLTVESSMGYILKVLNCKVYESIYNYDSEEIVGTRSYFFTYNSVDEWILKDKLKLSGGEINV